MKLLLVILLMNISVLGQLLMPGVGPIKSGNTWSYKERDNPRDFLYYRVTDSILTTDTMNYYKIILSERSYPDFEMYIGVSADSFFTRYRYPDTPYNYKFYKMNCNNGDKWVQLLYNRNPIFYTVTDSGDVFWYSFGRVVPLKKLQITDNQLIGLYQIWNDTLGLFSESGEEGYTYNLVGCVINGIAYGDTNKPTAIEDKDISVSDFHLYQNYPNPFNPNTTISYFLLKAEMVKVSIYNMLGQRVAELQNGFQNRGMHKLNFDGQNLSSGVYFYTINTGKSYRVKKMILQK